MRPDEPHRRRRAVPRCGLCGARRTEGVYKRQRHIGVGVGVGRLGDAAPAQRRREGRLDADHLRARTRKAEQSRRRMCVGRAICRWRRQADSGTCSSPAGSTDGHAPTTVVFAASSLGSTWKAKGLPAWHEHAPGYSTDRVGGRARESCCRKTAAVQPRAHIGSCGARSRTRTHTHAHAQLPAASGSSMALAYAPATCVPSAALVMASSP